MRVKHHYTIRYEVLPMLGRPDVVYSLSLSGIEAPTMITGHVKSIQREGDASYPRNLLPHIDLEVRDRLASFISGIQKAP